MSSLASRMVCAGCGAALAPDDPEPYRCPNSGDGSDADHVLARDVDLEGATLPVEGDPNPFVRFRELLHSYRCARRGGWTDEEYVRLVRDLDAAVERVDGRGFRQTPYDRIDSLSAELGVRGLWVKDETDNVSGSHKARHLMAVALHLAVTDTPADRRLGIASCGNAAFAASVLARATERELDTFVPPHADPGVLERLRMHGARVVSCERSAEDPPGDPCFLRFVESVGDGTLPFTCQGSQNALVIEGGATLTWELVTQHAAACERPLDRLFVQVGGGALASSCVQALDEARRMGALDTPPRIHTVQTRGAHPLERAWRTLVGEILRNLDGRGAGTPPPDAPDAVLAAFLAEHAGSAAVRDELAAAAANRSRYMRPWDVEPASVATGILDDETYDWLAVVRGMIETGGWPVVVDEATLLDANERAPRASPDGRPACVTGTAGLAGAFALARAGQFRADEEIAVLFTGARS